MAPPVLGKRLEELGDLLAHQPRNQPFEGSRIELIQEMQRYGQGNAVQRMPRLEAVGKPELRACCLDTVRKLRLRDAGGAVAHQAVPGQVEELRIGAFGLFAP